MSTVQEIESAIEQLPKEDVSKIALWLEDRLQSQWDKQIAEDAGSGKLDKFFAELTADDDSETDLDEVLGKEEF
ncbi:MAG: hypothetical protein O7C75_06460 [Verrucomicrobia bacterium]|nr:hypothetical protein [Verrucomicrobiota bacterium]